VSKKFCLSLKKSLWYGLCDMGRELTGRRRGGGEQGPEGDGRAGLRPKEFWAVNNVSFDLKRGECLGLIGRNGAGKTTLLKMLNGLIKPDAGQIEMRGRVGALISLGAGFNPILTGRENIYVNASVLGLTKKETDAKLDEIIDFAEIGDFIDTPVQNYSSGMAVRLGFAVATAMEPDILLLDEVLAVGDTMFRSKCFQRIGKILSKTSVIFVSHDQNQVARICDRVILLKGGQSVFQGETQEGLALYRGMNVSPVGSQSLWAPSISNPKFTACQASINWGDDIEFDLEFDAAEKIEIGLFLIHFMREESFVSHADLTESNMQIKPGQNRWRIRVRNCQFSVAKIYASVSIFSRDRKKTVLHMVNGASFDSRGSRGYGPPMMQHASITN
jgi:lipopolysaccharide transport system ATP-binding protein